MKTKKEDINTNFRRKWTIDEDIQLINYYTTDKLPINQLVTKLKRTRQAITGRLHLLGIHRKSINHTWTPEETVQLSYLYHETNLSLSEIGEHFGRSRDSVDGRLYREGIRYKKIHKNSDDTGVGGGDASK